MDYDQKNADMEAADEIMLPGFRFHPTDEELVGFYLRRKVQHRPLSIELIKQLDIYKFDPWDLPKMASIGEKEWYFYCPRDRKYRNSTRPNRVTVAGFWKATGTDRPIYSSDGIKCIGLKKSLVFYKGRAAKGIKTDWMMHEFRLPTVSDSTNASKKSIDKNNVPANDSWAICRVFKKNTIAQRALAHAWAPPLAERRAMESISSPMNSEIISDSCMNVNFNVSQEDNMSNETRNQTSTSSNLSSHTGDQCCNNMNHGHQQDLKPKNIDQLPCMQEAASYGYITSGLQGSAYNKIDASGNLMPSFSSGRSMSLPSLEVPCTNYFGSSHILDPNPSHVKGTLDLVSCMFHMSPYNIADHLAVRSSSGLQDITAAFAAPKINHQIFSSTFHPHDQQAINCNKDEDHADIVFRKTHSQLICPRSVGAQNLSLPSHPYDVVKTVSWDTAACPLEVSATDATD